MSILFTGRVRPLAPTGPDLAEAVLVDDDGRILAVGATDALAAAHPSAQRERLDGWIMPGLIEPHGHPGTAAVLLSDRVVDLRPVVVPTAAQVMDTLRAAISRAAESSGSVFANGWDALLQRGLPEPGRALLDEMAGSVPLVIVHNSGHSAYFNTAAADVAGISRDTPDPPGASFGRDASGDLSGVAQEARAVEIVTAPLLSAAQADIVGLLGAHVEDLARRGCTTVADLSWNPALNPAVEALRAAGRLPVRLRWYEMSRPGGAPRARGAGDAMTRQVGVKTWSDGSPWIGNIATSFPYLDTEATRALGLEPGHVGRANYSPDELLAIAEPYAAAGWQLACHAHGDLAIDQTLDVYEELIRRHGSVDHRHRLEHVGAMTPGQFRRAAALGVTVSLFVDHITYWGDVLVDDLFGPERGGAWADAGAAFAAGHRASFHNDGWVTPTEPFHNMAVAETRTSRTGRVMPGGSPVGQAGASRSPRTPSTRPGSCSARTRSDRCRRASSPTSSSSIVILWRRRPTSSPRPRCAPRTWPDAAWSEAARRAAAGSYSRTGIFTSPSRCVGALDRVRRVDMRVAAYAVITDEDERVLLARWTEGRRASWTMPGGGLEPGEDPEVAARREVREETGYKVVIDELLGIHSRVIPAGQRVTPGADAPLHTLRIVYRAHITGGRLRFEKNGTTDMAGWFDLSAIGGLPRVKLVDIALGMAGVMQSR